MIIGAHSIIYSKDPEADRAFLRDVLGLPNVDVGEGWLIFGLPPAEVAVHPSSENDLHEFYFMCEDIQSLVTSLSKRKVTCTPVQNLGWGLLTQMKLPGGGQLGVYQPRHARPKPMGASGPSGKAAPGKKATRRTGKVGSAVKSATKKTGKSATRKSGKAARAMKKETRRKSQVKTGQR